MDRDGEGGVTVRYHEHLVRYAWPADAAGLKGGDSMRSDDGLPGTWLYSEIIDRLKMTDEGWKLSERYLGQSVFNTKLDPPELVEPKV